MTDLDDTAIDWGPNAPMPTDDPLLHVYSDLDGRINAAADRQWFADHETTDAGVDHDQDLLVFDPNGDRRPLSISRGGDHGGDISLNARLREFIGADTISETVKLDLEERGGYIVADISGLEAAQGANGTTEGNDDEESYPTESDESESGGVTDSQEGADEGADTDLPFEPGHTSKPAVEDVVAKMLTDDEPLTLETADIADKVDANGSWIGRSLVQLDQSDAPVWVQREHKDNANRPTTYTVGTGPHPLDCDQCDYRAQTEGGLKTHYNSEHLSGDPEDQPDAAVPDAEDSPTPDTVRDCAKSVDTVQELADLLDLTEAEARFAARDADVYGELRDDVRRMGAATDD